MRIRIGNDHEERSVYLMMTGNVDPDVPVPPPEPACGDDKDAATARTYRRAGEGFATMIRVASMIWKEGALT
jgi:hypothetical protein